MATDGNNNDMNGHTSAKRMKMDTGENGCTHKKGVALITGVTGQDGSYLADLLLSKGYTVHGITRDGSLQSSRVEHLQENVNYGGNFHLHFGDLTNSASLIKLIRTIQPTEIYNLGAQSNVTTSFVVPEYTTDVDGIGTLRILDAILSCGLGKSARYYQASSSEMFGKPKESPQNETTPCHPRSPYGVSKLYAHWITINYRESYDIFACNGILFNHESPRRGKAFVTRKITNGVAKIHLGLTSFIDLGNLDCQRDWGHARDYVKAMWMMLQQENPEDFVIATGIPTTVRRFVELAFQCVNIIIEWEGEGVDEVGRDSVTRDIHVRVNPIFWRPCEDKILYGDISKAKSKLGWTPKTELAELVEEMVAHEIKLLQQNPNL